MPLDATGQPIGDGLPQELFGAPSRKQHARGQRCGPLDEAIHEAQTLFELGRQHYQTGDMAEARADFDRAVERLAAFPSGARGDARLADAYADLLSEIQEIETSSYQSGTPSISS